VLKIVKKRKSRFVVKSVEKSKKLRYYILARPEGLLFLLKKTRKIRSMVKFQKSRRCLIVH